MTTNQSPASEKTFACETCPMRKRAETDPKSFWSKLWRWHTTWCPGWKAYQTHLERKA